MPSFAGLIRRSPELRRSVLVVDVRERDFPEAFPGVYRDLKRTSGLAPRLAFLEADERTLLRRFSETRRPHPLAESGPAIEGIRAEREEVGLLVDEQTQHIVPGRNDEDGESFSQFALRLTKAFNIGSGNIDVIVEAFNLFDQTNYDINSIDSAEFLGGPTLANPALPYRPNPNFGNYRATLPGREIQLGLRYAF